MNLDRRSYTTLLIFIYLNLLFKQIFNSREPEQRSGTHRILFCNNKDMIFTDNGHLFLLIALEMFPSRPTLPHFIRILCSMETCKKKLWTPADTLRQKAMDNYHAYLSACVNARKLRTMALVRFFPGSSLKQENL